MTIETEVPAATAEEVSASISAGYDRIANPEKEESAAPTAEVLAAETPSEPTFTRDQIKDVMTQVSRIPDLEKQLRDAGGRYGALKQSLEQMQQRLAAPSHTGTAAVDVDDMLKEVKEEFGEEGLYTSLKSAFSKMASGRAVDPDLIKGMVEDGIKATKQAETEAAMDQLTAAHPTWQEDRHTPEFEAWKAAMPAKERDRLTRSNDPFYVADRLDDFNEWKAKQKEAPATKEPIQPAKPVQTVSKRLAGAVMPTGGVKSVAADTANPKQSIRAGYDRVAGNRR